MSAYEAWPVSLGIAAAKLEVFLRAHVALSGDHGRVAARSHAADGRTGARAGLRNEQVAGVDGLPGREIDDDVAVGEAAQRNFGP